MSDQASQGTLSPVEPQAGLQPEAATAAVSAESQVFSPESEEATAVEVHEQEPERKKRSPWEIVRDREKTIREQRESLARMERMLEQQMRQPQQPEAPKGDGAPNPDDYPAGKYDADYLQAVVEHKVRTQVQDRMRAEVEQMQRAAQQNQARARIMADEKRFAADKPDYAHVREALLNSPLAEHPGVSAGIALSESPAALIYALGTDPDLAYEVANLDPFAASRRLGMLEAELKIRQKPIPKTPIAPTPQVSGHNPATAPRSSMDVDWNQPGAYQLFEKLRNEEEKARYERR